MVPVNRLLLTIDEESARIETQSGLILHVDTYWKPETGAAVNGVLESTVPPFFNSANTKRRYWKDDGYFLYKYRDFSNPLKEGDRVWFSYQASLNDQWMTDMTGDKTAWVPFDDLLFYERDGQGPHAMPGIVVIKPIKVKKSFLAYKVEELEYVEGKRPPELLRGEVVSVGEPLRGQSRPPYAPGDVIVFQTQFLDTSMRYRHQTMWGVDMEEVLVVLPERAEGSQPAL